MKERREEKRAPFVSILSGQLLCSQARLRDKVPSLVPTTRDVNSSRTLDLQPMKTFSLLQPGANSSFRYDRSTICFCPIFGVGCGLVQHGCLGLYLYDALIPRGGVQAREATAAVVHDPDQYYSEAFWNLLFIPRTSTSGELRRQRGTS